jgi:hypothetical protein
MQQLKRDEQGVIAIMAVIALATLLAAGSLVFVAASMRPVKRDAQGRADAGAVASALACVNSSTCTGAAASGYAGGNVLLSSSSCGSNSCTDTMKQNGNYKFVTSAPSVTASATAKWGQLKKGFIFAFTFCANAFPNVPIGTPVLLHSNTVSGCSGQGGNAKGFLLNGCQMASIGGTYQDANGNSFIGTNCKGGSSLNANLNVNCNCDVLLPVWSAASGTTYTLGQMVQFRLLGWSGNGNSASDRGGQMSSRCTPSGPYVDGGGSTTNPCAYGYVVKYGATTGGTTGAACATGALANACYVYLDH